MEGAALVEPALHDHLDFGAEDVGEGAPVDDRDLRRARRGIDPAQVARFVDTVVAGARQFWSSEAMQAVSAPIPAAAPAV